MNKHCARSDEHGIDQTIMVGNNQLLIKWDVIKCMRVFTLTGLCKQLYMPTMLHYVIKIQSTRQANLLRL
jgi:hypothetical protein